MHAGCIDFLMQVTISQCYHHYSENADTMLEKKPPKTSIQKYLFVSTGREKMEDKRTNKKKPYNRKQMRTKTLD